MIAKCFVYLAGIIVSAALAAPMDAATSIAHATAPQGVVISEKAQTLAPVMGTIDDGTEPLVEFCSCCPPSGSLGGRLPINLKHQPSNLQRKMSNSTKQINTNVDPLLIANKEEITVKSAQNQEEPQENHKDSKENKGLADTNQQDVVQSPIVVLQS
ncbi:hypothetical protein PCANC_14205 [Puccinia coronata f. sp. avenae]|uniref:Secreted protein n=1 Tax=Puccinia coronata f. sp. avenae TaxID=200324 RepID=A0A2N5SYQ3_9BASI|nr:hypothetical protein PCANC_14205 [Puccinia coronata f. sp. avenae]